MKTSLLRSQFFGTKEELVAEIANYEANHPDLYLLRRKKTGAPLPVTPRRIQQYCDEGIIERAVSIDGKEAAKGRYFNTRHLVAYLAAIRFKKSGQPVSNLAGLLAGKSDQDLETIALGDEAPEQPLYQTSERLKRLGRKEGRALKSRQLRYAITPDVHVYVGQKILNSLNADDADALAQAFKDALLEDING